MRIRRTVAKGGAKHTVFRVGEVHGVVTDRVKELVEMFSKIDSSKATTTTATKGLSAPTVRVSSTPLANPCPKTAVRKPNVAPDYDRDVEADIKHWFETYYSVQWRNYPVDESYLHDSELVPTIN